MSALLLSNPPYQRALTLLTRWRDQQKNLKHSDVDFWVMNVITSLWFSFVLSLGVYMLYQGGVAVKGLWPFAAIALLQAAFAGYALRRIESARAFDPEVPYWLKEQIVQERANAGANMTSLKQWLHAHKPVTVSSLMLQLEAVTWASRSPAAYPYSLPAVFTHADVQRALFEAKEASRKVQAPSMP